MGEFPNYHIYFQDLEILIFLRSNNYAKVQKIKKAMYLLKDT